MKVECPSCGVFNDARDENCWKCQRTITDSEREVAERAEQAKSEKDLRVADRLRESAEMSALRAKWVSVPINELKEAVSHIRTTTAYELAGCKVESEVGIVAAECVIGMNIILDVFASFRDFFGGRSGATQNVLREAREVALLELRREAMLLQANGIIAIELSYQTISGKGMNMMLVCASGTAVRTMPIG